MRRIAPLAATAGVAAGGGLVVGVWMLLARTQRPAYEIRSYVHDTHAAAEGAVENFRRGTQAIDEMRSASEQLPEAMRKYLETASA